MEKTKKSELVIWKRFGALDAKTASRIPQTTTYFLTRRLEMTQLFAQRIVVQGTANPSRGFSRPDLPWSTQIWPSHILFRIPLEFLFTLAEKNLLAKLYSKKIAYYYY